MEEELQNLMPDYKRWQKAFRNFTYILVVSIFAFQVALFFARRYLALISDEKVYLTRQLLNPSIFNVAVLVIETIMIQLSKKNEERLNITPVIATLFILASISATSSSSIIFDGYLVIPLVMSVIFCNKKLTRITYIASQVMLLCVYSMHYWVRQDFEHHAMVLDAIIGSLLLFTVHLVENIIMSLIQEQNKKVLRATQQAQAAEEKAAISDNAKTAFLANISHEIRTPMNAIVGMTDLMLREKNRENMRGYARNIKASGDSLLSIISDILDFSRMQTGNVELSEQMYEVEELVDGLARMAWNRIGKKDVEVLFDIDNKIPAILYGDDKRLKQVVTNLLTNAIKYTDHGFIKLTMKAEGVVEDEIKLYVSVEDTGRGMKQSDLEKVFSAFEQIDVKKNKKQEGTGMGLSISREIVQLMGGELKANSEEGRGSIFFFTVEQHTVEKRTNIEEEPPLEKIVVGGHTKNDCATVELLSQVKHMGIKWKDAEPDEEIDYYFSDDAEYLMSADAVAEMELDDVKFVYLYNPVDGIPEGLAEEILVVAKPLYAAKIDAVLRGKLGSRGEEEKDSGTEAIIDFIAPQARLLLVDDNEMNLTVAEALLAPTKMTIDKAENGKRAVEMIQKNHYDFVFMDHMMPIMDGVEATKMVREMEGEYYQTLPIIAFTANVLPEASKEFKEAGMNDFVTKPVQLKALCGKIKQYIAPGLLKEVSEEELAETEEAPVAEGTEELSIDKLDGIDTKAGIEACGSESLFRKLLGDYCRLIDLKCTKLEKCLADGMIRDYTIEVHALKNTSRMIGATELSEWFKQMEAYGNAEDVKAIEAENGDLLATYRSYKRVLEPFMDAGDATKQEADIDELIADLKNMDHAMDTFDLDTVAALMKKIQSLRVPECVKEKERLLEAYVADVAMEEVMQTTKEMVSILEEMN